MNHSYRYSARTEEKIYNFYLQIVKVCGTLSKLEKEERRNKPVSSIRIPQRTLEEIQPHLIYQDSIENIKRRFNPVSSIMIPQRTYRGDSTPSYLSGFQQRTLEEIQPRLIYQDSIENLNRRYNPVSSFRIPQRTYRGDTTLSH